MKSIAKGFALSALTASLLLVGCNNNASSGAAKTKIDDQSSDIQKASYVFGADIGNNMQASDLQLDLDAFFVGLKAAYNKEDLAFSDEQMRAIVDEFAQKEEARIQEKHEAQAKDNLAASEKFLAENAKKEGVQTTASGLQYKVLKEGSGASPKASDEVAVHYEGRLLDGTVFDSSYERGKPAVFPVDGVIPGWTEALQLMKPGGSYELYIPPELAYGEIGNPSIEPNSLLIFKVDLLSDSDAAQAKEAALKAQEEQMQEFIRNMQEQAAQAESAQQ